MPVTATQPGASLASLQVGRMLRFDACNIIDSLIIGGPGKSSACQGFARVYDIASYSHLGNLRAGITTVVLEVSSDSEQIPDSTLIIKQVAIERSPFPLHTFTLATTNLFHLIFISKICWVPSIRAACLRILQTGDAK